MGDVVVLVVVLPYVILFILCSTPSSSSSLFTSLSLVSCPLCGAPVPLGTNTLEVKFQLCWCASCIGIHPGAGQPGRPSLKQAGPGERNVAPGGPWQYHAVQQYSVVRSAWGPGGVAIFLNRSAYTPLRSLIGVLLIPPVRCMSCISGS